MHERAGTPATPADLINIDELLDAYWQLQPDPQKHSQRVSFGTSGHRGSSLTRSFNEKHIQAICAAIAQYRRHAGITGPLFLGADSHPLSKPALQTARATLAAHGVHVILPAQLLETENRADTVRPGQTLQLRAEHLVPTPALSLAIIQYNKNPATKNAGLADGIIITPSHNPPADGGIKYNPPHGGPAGTEETTQIEKLANQILETWVEGTQPPEASPAKATGKETGHNYIEQYAQEIAYTIDMPAIREAGRRGLRAAVHPLGGAALAYWRRIRDMHQLPIDIVCERLDPCWAFMTLDWDGKIRMDPSSKHAMKGAQKQLGNHPILVANDADADRHGIVTEDTGLMNPNHFLAAALNYLLQNRENWPKKYTVGKTIVTSLLINKIAEKHGKHTKETPVGFKWFVNDLNTTTTPAPQNKLFFAGEESAGATLRRLNGDTWTTDKDGIALGLLAIEILAKTGKTPSKHYKNITKQLGKTHYQREDTPASKTQKTVLTTIKPETLQKQFFPENTLAGDPITTIENKTKTGDKIGGIIVRSQNSWLALRPSGTENILKIYAETQKTRKHLQQILETGRNLINNITTTNTHKH